MTEGTTYYVRAYATNSKGTSYGEQRSFIPSSLFSVSSSKQVRFSKGNLQYQASTNTWRFAENQYDCIGDDNSNISSLYSGWIDLFGWGTSGYNSKYPYMISTTNSDYGDSNNNISGTNYDWGVYNAISNGGNQAGMWRTLTNDEWFYLFNTRTDASSKYSQATVNDVRGLVILSDSWTLPNGCSFTPYQEYVTDYETNTYSSTQWSAMESAGAVFLPAAGSRSSVAVSSLKSSGYWSSSYKSTNYVYELFFSSSFVNSSASKYQSYGRSVRLVADY